MSRWRGYPEMGGGGVPSGEGGSNTGGNCLTTIIHKMFQTNSSFHVE